jgi:hypothetical protein
MSPLPIIDEANRRKPLCYDPKRDKFIYYDELVAGSEKIIPLRKLTHDQLKKLVIERNRSGPDYTVQTPGGPKYTRDDVIREINGETAFGKMSMKAEEMSLSRLLKQIEENL